MENESQQKPVRTAFFISGSTAITAEALGRSMLTQFSEFEFEQVTIPYIVTEEQIQNVVEQINAANTENSHRPLVFSTLTDARFRDILATSKALVLDMFAAFLAPLEQEIGTPSSQQAGRSHAIQDVSSYRIRIDAVHFALENDDGAIIKYYDQADMIVIGVSRSGKTPTCLYMALQFGLYMANYPLTEEDFDRVKLPDLLMPYRHKLFALTIDVDRLAAIRSERRANSRYASLQQCELEIRAFEALIQRYKIPHLNVSELSIEEIATRIVAASGVKRRI